MIAPRRKNQDVCTIIVTPPACLAETLSKPQSSVHNHTNVVAQLSEINQTTRDSAMFRFTIRDVLWLTLLIGLAGCGSGKNPGKNVKTDHYAVAEQSNDGWSTASLGSDELSIDLTEKLLTQIRNGTYKNIHSILIVKDGRLVVEEYFPGQEDDGRHQVYQRHTLHGIHSATKSINSILIGIAIDQKLIQSVDEKVSTFFPEHADLFADGKRDVICLKHLLS